MPHLSSQIDLLILIYVKNQSGLYLKTYSPIIFYLCAPIYTLPYSKIKIFSSENFI